MRTRKSWRWQAAALALSWALALAALPPAPDQGAMPPTAHAASQLLQAADREGFSLPAAALCALGEGDDEVQRGPAPGSLAALPSLSLLDDGRAPNVSLSRPPPVVRSVRHPLRC
jgi:hypothetical protein